MGVKHIGASYRQETVRPEISRLRFAALEMTGRENTTVFLTGRKLLAKGFLLWYCTLVLLTGRKRFDRRFLGSSSDPRNDNERDKALCHLERGGVSKWE